MLASIPLTNALEGFNMEVARWSVLLTKHKTQKSKTYQEGSLAVKAYTPTQRKVFLFDSESKPLEDKYLRASEQIESGRILEFQRFFVEIGEPLEDKPPPSPMVSTEMAPSHTTSSFYRQKTISDCFRSRSQISGAASSPETLSVSFSSTSGKKKKWRDGTLRCSPKNPLKVSLLEDYGAIVGKKTLEKDDVLAPGSEVQFGPYLVSIDKEQQEPKTASSADLSDEFGKCDNPSVRAEEVPPAFVQDELVSSIVEHSKQPLESKKEPLPLENKEGSNKRNRSPWPSDQILQRCKKPKPFKQPEQQDLPQPKMKRISSCQLQGDNGPEPEDSRGRTEQSLHAHKRLATTGQNVAGKVDVVRRNSQNSTSPNSALGDGSRASIISGSSWPYQSTWTPAKALRVQAMRESQRPFQAPQRDTLLASEKPKHAVRGEPLLDGTISLVGDEDGDSKVESIQVDGVNKSDVVIQDSLNFSAEHSSCSLHMEQVLAAHCFQVVDFWEGYKLYCFGYYSSSESHRREFSRSKMGQIMREMYEESSFVWGPRFDDTVRSAWSFMEDYLQERHGLECTDISILVDKYEDAEQLKATADGQLLLAIAKDNSGLARHRSVELALRNSKRIRRNNILQRIDQEVNRVNAGLANLQKHSKQDPHGQGVQQEDKAKVSGQPEPSHTSDNRKDQVRYATPRLLRVSKKQVGRMDDDSPIFLVEGQPDGVLPMLPSVPTSVATARFCKVAELSKFAGQGDALSHFDFRRGSTTWICETEDFWTLEQENTLLEMAPAIAKACNLPTDDSMVALVSSSVTALLRSQQGPWWIFSISFMDGPEE